MKAQELPINMLVVAGLAVLVLIILAAAFQSQFIGALRSIFGFSATATPEQAEIYISSCSRYCNLMPKFISRSEYLMSEYCTSKWNTFVLDSNAGIENDYCYQDTNENDKVGIINVPCSNHPENCNNCQCS